MMLHSGSLTIRCSTLLDGHRSGAGNPWVAMGSSNTKGPNSGALPTPPRVPTKGPHQGSHQGSQLEGSNPEGNPGSPTGLFANGFLSCSSTRDSYQPCGLGNHKSPFLSAHRWISLQPCKQWSRESSALLQERQRVYRPVGWSQLPNESSMVNICTLLKIEVILSTFIGKCFL